MNQVVIRYRKSKDDNVPGLKRKEYEQKLRKLHVRYVPHFPSAGEIVIFDRSWYNRAGVERVMGFCTEDQAKGFLRVVPNVERAMVESEIVLLKYWLEESRRANQPPHRADRRRAKDLEAVPDGLGFLYAVE